jgi:hypothetical protein
MVLIFRVDTEDRSGMCQWNSGLPLQDISFYWKPPHNDPWEKVFEISGAHPRQMDRRDFEIGHN